MLEGPQAVAAIPGAQGGRGDPQASGNRGNGQARLNQGFSGHEGILLVNRPLCIPRSGLVHTLFELKHLTNLWRGL